MIPGGRPGPAGADEGRASLGVGVPGVCRQIECGDAAAITVQAQRLTGEWTSGMDYCADHAGAFVERMCRRAWPTRSRPAARP